MIAVKQVSVALMAGAGLMIGGCASPVGDVGQSAQALDQQNPQEERQQGEEQEPGEQQEQEPGEQQEQEPGEQYGEQGPYGQPGQQGQYGEQGPYGQPGEQGQYGEQGPYGQPGELGPGQQIPGQGPGRFLPGRGQLVPGYQGYQGFGPNLGQGFGYGGLGGLQTGACPGLMGIPGGVFGTQYGMIGVPQMRVPYNLACPQGIQGPPQQVPEQGQEEPPQRYGE